MSCKNCSIQRGLKKVRSFLGSRSQWERGNVPRSHCSLAPRRGRMSRSLTDPVSGQSNLIFHSEKKSRGVCTILFPCGVGLKSKFPHMRGKHFTSRLHSPRVAPSTAYIMVYPQTQPWRSPRKRKKISYFLYHFQILFLPPQEQNGLDLCFQVPLTVGSSFHLPPSHTCT